MSHINPEVQLQIGEFSPTEKLADPSLSMFYKQLNDRHLWLDGEIDIENVSYFIQYIEYMNRHAENPELEKPITLHIFSPGGDLDTMFAMYDCIKKSKIPIHTINEGGAHSAAFIIFLAGHRRSMRPNAIFIAHQGGANIMGTYKQTRSSLKQYEKLVDKMVAIIVDETILDTETIKNRFSEDEDWHIDLETALQYKIITG